MAELPNKSDDNAEKAYAAAAAEVKPAAPAKGSVPLAPQAAPASEAAKSPAPASAKVPSAKAEKVAVKKVAKAPAKKSLAGSTKPAASAVPVAAKAPPALKAAPAAKPQPAKKPALAAAKPAPAKAAPIASKPPIIEPKDSPMATEFNSNVNSAMSEMQDRAKTAYEKSTEMVTEMTDLAKGNVEALVESSRIFAGGVQSLGKDYVEEAKSAYETLTGDLKEMAAVKSPTELFQLQGKIMRRNFDALVSTSSKNAEAMMKLANESFAPISGRVNVAAEKMAKVA